MVFPELDDSVFCGVSPKWGFLGGKEPLGGDLSLFS